MKITSLKTEKIVEGSLDLKDFLDSYIKRIEEKSILVITSKVISIIEKRTKPLELDKDKLIEQDADFIAKKPNKYGRYLTVKCNAFISSAGIDESNGNGSYIFLPENPQKTARWVYGYLSKKFKTKDWGVIITDSRSLPLRAGATGVAIGFWGFAPLKSYIGKPDVFGRKLKYEKSNVLDALAGAAVLAMGEGSEQTPLAVITNVNQIEFCKTRPNKNDLKEFYVSLEDDIFHQFYQKLRP